RLFGQIDVAEEADQGGHGPAELSTKGALDQARVHRGRIRHGGRRQASGRSWNGRTSTAPRQAADPLRAHSRAASRSGTSMIQKPPTCSLVSANGPSVVRTSPSLTRTTVAVSAGCSPLAKTHAPLAWTSALNSSTSLKI